LIDELESATRLVDLGIGELHAVARVLDLNRALLPGEGGPNGWPLGTDGREKSAR